MTTRAARELAIGVVLQLVVQTDGVPDTSSVEIVQATYRDFAVSILGQIKDFRFRPAYVDGCAVPVLVRLPFDFKIRR